MEPPCSSITLKRSGTCQEKWRWFTPISCSHLLLFAFLQQNLQQPLTTGSLMDFQALPSLQHKFSCRPFAPHLPLLLELIHVRTHGVYHRIFQETTSLTRALPKCQIIKFLLKLQVFRAKQCYLFSNNQLFHISCDFIGFCSEGHVLWPKQMSHIKNVVGSALRFALRWQWWWWWSS